MKMKDKPKPRTDEPKGKSSVGVKFGPFETCYEGNIFTIKKREIFFFDGSKQTHEYCQRFNSITVLKKLNNKSIKLVSLPEILLYGLGVKTPKVHTTIIAGTGFFNIKDNCNSVELLKIHHKLTRKNIFLQFVPNSLFV